MSYADAHGVKLYVEETGTRYPIVFVHEFFRRYGVRSCHRTMTKVRFSQVPSPAAPIPWRSLSSTKEGCSVGVCALTLCAFGLMVPAATDENL